MKRADKTEPADFVRRVNRGVFLDGGFVYVDASGALCVEVNDDHYSGRVTDPVALARIGRALLGFHAWRTSVAAEANAYWVDTVLLACLGDEETRVNGRGIWWAT